MGMADDVAVNVGSGLAQMAYFKFKNSRRAKAFTRWSAEHGFKFWKKAKDYDGAIMELPAADVTAAHARGGSALSMKARTASKFFGESPLQTKLWNFSTNRYRGEWQTNANIMEGSWQGRTMTSFDTLWFEFADGENEGEYSSVFAHIPGRLPRMIITPAGFLAGLKRAAEDQLINRGFHRLQFELTEFNKNWHVTAADEREAYDFISPEMIDFLMNHVGEKWHLESGDGGLLISTMLTLPAAKIEMAMDFLAGFIDHVAEDLLRSVDGDTAAD